MLSQALDTVASDCVPDSAVSAFANRPKEFPVAFISRLLPALADGHDLEKSIAHSFAHFTVPSYWTHVKEELASSHISRPAGSGWESKNRTRTAPVFMISFVQVKQGWAVQYTVWIAIVSEHCRSAFCSACVARHSSSPSPEGKPAPGHGRSVQWFIRRGTPLYPVARTWLFLSTRTQPTCLRGHVARVPISRAISRKYSSLSGRLVSMSAVSIAVLIIEIR